MYERLYRRGFTHMDAERAHHLALSGLAAAAALPGGLKAIARDLPEPDERLRLRVWNLPFANPLGVAAGLDKDGIAVEALVALGFGHVEVGTITLRAQPGNDRPRIWRVPEKQAIINAMGFPSSGSASVRKHLIGMRPRGVVGINIGKNRDTPIERAADDYASLIAVLFPVAHYITINVSSPNTPGLRALQMTDELAHLISTARDANERSASLARRDPKPLLIKIAPDLTNDEVERVADAAVANGASGIIATNTTTSRAGLPDACVNLPGGLSGPPLRERANDITRILYRQIGHQVPIIGVGGITSGADAIARIRSGASLVQLYTAFTIAGPSLPAQILRDLSADADRNGWTSILDLVGTDAG